MNSFDFNSRLVSNMVEYIPLTYRCGVSDSKSILARTKNMVVFDSSHIVGCDHEPSGIPQHYRTCKQIKGKHLVE